MVGAAHCWIKILAVEIFFKVVCKFNISQIKSTQIPKEKKINLAQFKQRNIIPAVSNSTF